MKRKKFTIQQKPIVPRSPEGNEGGGFDGLTQREDKPLQTAQLIGSLVIRFVLHAQARGSWQSFPDRGLLEAILANSGDRAATEEHLTALLFHHSKILDNCGTPGAQLRYLAKNAFPKATLKLLDKDPDWEMLPEP